MSSLPVPESVVAEPRELPASHLIPYTCLTIPASARTLAGFCDWMLSPSFPERGKISYLNGDIEIDMSPEEVNAHSLIKQEISMQLGLLIKKRRLGLLFPDRVALVNED